ncbi:acyltransferase family protein [Roseovarius sp. THAF9]|uniref:acyltransferase family protein n=1 Tax=Roseovarius sp. THAF9 TaxID=2587847 RepID=UPI001562433B|nr:acyltransferase family protein [Roseovarius sp. THAF9]
MPPQISLTSVESPRSGGGWLQRSFGEYPPDSIAQITFTSGTEGTPKGIAISHRALSDTVSRLNDVMEVDETIREYIGVPVYYSFGFGRCRAVCRAGGAAYIPEKGFSLTDFAAMLRDGKVNALSAVPTLLRLVLRNPELFDQCGARLRWIEIGSQYMAPEEKAALCEIFPNARIVMHYGMTEASRTTFQIVSETTGEALGGVGHAYGEVELALAPDGRIRIRGPHVASYALEQGEQRDLTDMDGWYQSNDLGEFRDGQLWFLGRADDVINVSGVKVSSEAIEQKLHAVVPDPTRVAVTPFSDPLRGEKVLVATEPDAGLELETLKEIAETVLTDIHPALKGAVQVSEIDHIPRTQTNKVRRKALRETLMAASEDNAPASDMPPARVRAATRLDTVIALFERQFPRAKITPDTTLESVGGTSLDYVELSLALEQSLGHDPGDWHTATVRELAQAAGSDGWSLKFDQMAARAACAFLVVLAHVIGDTPESGLHLPGDHPMRLFNEFANYFKMPLFAFVSGWSFALLGTAAMRPANFAQSTFKTLIVPTVLSMLAFAGLVSAIGRSSGAHPPGLADVFLYPYEHFWFIQTLILLVVVVYAAMRLPERLRFIALSALVVLPIAMPWLFGTNILSINGILVLGPFYALGILLSDKIATLAQRPGLTLIVIGATSLAGIVFAYLVFDRTGGVLLMPHPAGFLIGLPLVFLCLLVSAYLPFVKRIAPYTFYIYLWHVFATSATRRALYSAGVEDLGIHIVAGLGAGIAVPVLACLALQRFGLFAVFSGRW